MTAKNRYYVPAWVQRFDDHQRWQHLLLAISVLMLIITGFPIKFAYTWWAPHVMSLFGGFKNMLTVHKMFGVVMIFSGIYHLTWLFIKIPSLKRAKWAIIPSLKDVRDAYYHARYLLGFGKMPKYDRYAYLEKFEYFAVVWGVIIMSATGFVLWFPELAAIYLPRWVISIFRVVHSFEALVCLIAVVIGHFYSVHFNPDVFPSSPVWIDGKISREHLKHEHPLEYDEIAAENIARGIVFEDEEPVQLAGRFKDSIVLQSVLLIAYIGIFAWILVSFVPMLFVFG
ncbi:MAG: cytochrome b/b6 domain-containing protein [Clostridia bacterium]|jgi:cytochrome b subunit of formate dehydrogenase|nr:cytochrome b/b6 domain-containing protein [Clostridia bacterium]